jgi:glycosyltransferase involved in cell wall biosynthesis
VGVVIAAYNPVRDDLLRAVESVRNQTYTDWECIVVDDGSDPPILIDGVTVIRQENRGVSAARNRAAAAVGGEYLAFLDQDDYWHPEKLDRQVAFIEERDLAMCDTDFEIIRDGKRLASGYADHKGDFCRLLSPGGIGLSTLIVRRDAFEHVGGFNPLFPTIQDWELALSVAHVGYRFDRLHEVLCSYHLHGRNASSDYRSTYREGLAVYDLYTALDPRSAVRAAARSGRKKIRQQYALKAIDAFRSTRDASHLAWAARRNPTLVVRSVAAKLVRGSRTGRSLF